ncbi:hypothetical protein O3P69_004378 [Scylla paramamosain]|uniref:Uncharacterized protein n=1 Tax=Scylla paramamosain TaxID=85552 RepID=A0AAW0UFU5_SCYPA
MRRQRRRAGAGSPLAQLGSNLHTHWPSRTTLHYPLFPQTTTGASPPTPFRSGEINTRSFISTPSSLPRPHQLRLLYEKKICFSTSRNSSGGLEDVVKLYLSSRDGSRTNSYSDYSFAFLPLHHRHRHRRHYRRHSNPPRRPPLRFVVFCVPDGDTDEVPLRRKNNSRQTGISIAPTRHPLSHYYLYPSLAPLVIFFGDVIWIIQPGTVRHSAQDDIDDDSRTHPNLPGDLQNFLKTRVSLGNLCEWSREPPPWVPPPTCRAAPRRCRGPGDTQTP